MPNAVVGALRVILSADTAEFKSGLDEAAKLTKSFSTVAAAAIAATATAVGAITVAVIKLAEHGSDVADISNQFKVLNNEIGNSADAIRGKLRSAFAGTVSDFELMKATNIALSQGLQLNADQFEVVGQSARVLADRVGGDAKDAFEKLTMAMATGQDRQLKSIGLNIDAEAAVRKYADAIGKERSELTESETITAKKNAILAELNRTLKVSGKAQFDFADAVKASRVMIDNFRDSLGQAIAESPVVNAMLATFQKGIESAFGVDQQAMVVKLTGLVNKFAIFLVDLASVAVTSANIIYRAFSGLEVAFNFVMDGITGIIATLLESTATALELATKIPIVGDSYKEAAWEARGFADTAKGVSEGFAEQTKRAMAGAAGTDAFGQATDRAQAFLARMRAAMVEASNAQVKNTEAVGRGTTVVTTHGAAAVTTSAQIDRLTASWIRQIKAYEAAREASKQTLSPVAVPDDFILPKADFNLPSMAITEFGEASKAAEEWAMKNGAVLAPSIRAVSTALDDSTDKVRTWGETIGDALLQVPKLVQDAFTGGGGLGGAAKGIASMFGSAGIGKLFDAKGLIGKHLGSLTKLFGDSFLPGLGQAIGSLIGPAISGLKKVFGIGINDEIKKFNAEIDKSRQKLLAQFGSMERIRKLGQAVGVDLAGAWNHQGEAGKAAFEKIAKEFEEAVAKMESDLEDFKGDLTDAIDEARELGFIFDQNGKFIEVRFEKMQELANEFGVSLDSLGPSFHAARLAADAGKIINAFDLLTRGGASIGTVLFGMKDEISKLVQESMKFGTTIPENMRPWIQNLIDTRQLLDENGDAITDIGKINFGPKIETQFERISNKITELIDKISLLIETLTGQLTPALDNATKDRTIRIGYEVEPVPNTELAFASGTLGRTGKWFSNFGTGMAATLHGMEAVVTPQQAPAFAMDVLSGLSATQAPVTRDQQRPTVIENVIENRILLDGHEMRRWQSRSFAEDIENNTGGIRSRLQDGLGVVTNG